MENSFKASTGLETIMKINKNKTKEDMLKEYVNKIGIPEETIGKELIFL